MALPVAGSPRSAAGLAACVWAPCEMEATIGGARIEVSTDTDYPFRDTARVSLRASVPVRFPLLLRVPAWAEGAQIRVGGRTEAVPPRAGEFCRIEREWRGTTEIELRFPMRGRLWQGYRGAVAVERGPLVYSLAIGEEWKRINADKPHRELPHGDWEVHPTTPWSYALDVSAATLEEDLTFVERPVGATPFSPTGAPVIARARGRRVPGWEKVHGSAADVPEGPVHSREPLEDLTLVPYGCTSLRMTELPLLAR